MKFPLVSRKRAEFRLALVEQALAKTGTDYAATVEELAKVKGHNTTLKATLGTARADLVTAKEEIKGQKAEIDRLTAAFEKLTADYNDLGKKIPAFRPKAIRWSGPDGARAAIERAAYAESHAGKQEAAAKLSI